MGTEIYTINSREMKPWYELVPNKIKKVLESPGPCDRLLVCVEEGIWETGNGEREFFNNISGVEYTSSCDFNPKDYDELSLSEPEKFFETHATSIYCYDIPEMAITKRSTFAFYSKVAKGLATLQITNRHFLICVSQEFGAHVMFLTNCDVCARAVDEFSPRTPVQPAPQPKPLEWLTDEQFEIISLRLELFKRDFQHWCNYEAVTPPKELFGNSLDFIKMCRSKKLLEGASSILEYKRLRALRLDILSLQGLGLLCNSASDAEKILNPLKPYLDAVYDLPLPVKEDSDNE